MPWPSTMVISLARVIFDSSRWTRCEMGSDWFSQGQLGFVAWPAAAALAGLAVRQRRAGQRRGGERQRD